MYTTVTYTYHLTVGFTFSWWWLQFCYYHVTVGYFVEQEHDSSWILPCWGPIRSPSEIVFFLGRHALLHRKYRWNPSKMIWLRLFRTNNYTVSTLLSQDNNLHEYYKKHLILTRIVSKFISNHRFYIMKINNLLLHAKVKYLIINTYHRHCK